MTGRVGILRPEGGAKGVHLAESRGHGLGFQLAGHGQVGGTAEEVLGEVHGSVLGAGHIVQIQRGHPEHLACALAVGPGDQRRMGVDKAVLLEELVNGVSCHAAHPEGRRKGVGAGAQMGHGAQKFNRVAFFLQRILGAADTQHPNFVGVHLKGLLGARGQHHPAGHLQAGAHTGLGDLPVVVQLGRFEHDLQRLEAAAVRQFDEADVLGIAHRSGPAAHGDNRAVRRGLAVELANLRSFHCTSLLKIKNPTARPSSLGRIAVRSAVPPKLPPKAVPFPLEKALQLNALPTAHLLDRKCSACGSGGFFTRGAAQGFHHPLLALPAGSPYFSPSLPLAFMVPFPRPVCQVGTDSPHSTTKVHGKRGLPPI